LTIESQVAALRERIAIDGGYVEDEMLFLDEGASGAILVRPALERLRDAAWAGAVDRLYVHSPDRLARNYAHQVVLLEEFQRHDVEVIFLNHEPSTTPEGTLLLQMQGMIAEYERAKILERTRRGRRFAARQGKVSILSNAPYGYRYVPKHLTGGEARYDVVPEESDVVREIFRWVGVEALSLAAVVRRLAEEEIPTATGKSRWDKTTIRGMLRNPAYKGMAMYGKTRLSPRKPRIRPRRGDPETPRRPKVAQPTDPTQQQPVPVPALVSEELFDAVAEQLAANRRWHRERPQQKFLLSGLLVCHRCGSAYSGQRSHRGDGRVYTYYRCLGADRHRYGGEQLCQNRGLNGERLESSVWTDACALLQDPSRVRRELQRRLERSGSKEADLEARRTRIAGLKRRLTRLLDAYEHDWAPSTELGPRLQRVKEQLSREEKALTVDCRDVASVSQVESQVDSFITFAVQVAESLAAANDDIKRDILRLLIKRIEVDEHEVRIVYKVQPPPFVQSPAKRGGFLQLRLRRRIAALQDTETGPLSQSH
jgi:site-specific DNA recombinase